MSYIRNIAPGVIRYTCGRFSINDLLNETTVHTAVTTDLVGNSLTVDDLKNNIVLLDFLAEGHDEKKIQPLVDYLSNLVGIDNVRVLFNAVIDVDPLPYRARSFVTHFTTWDGRFVNEGDQETVKLDKKFLCLARRPNLSRARFLGRLLDSIPDVRASFGSGFPHDINQYQTYFSNIVLPILADGDARQYVHNRATDIFRTCLFNIVVETSNQRETNGWNSIFLTEKTFKCFDLYQIPIWFAVPGTVAQVRKLGFDLFDDIVDHSYDTIINEAERINSIVAQIAMLNNKFSLEDCQKLRGNLYSRIKSNLATLDNLTASYTQTQDRLIDELIA